MIVSADTALYLGVEIVRSGESFAIPDLQIGMSLVALGLMSQTVGWLIITHSLPCIPAGIAGLMILLQPSLAFVWDVIFLTARPRPWRGAEWSWPCRLYIWGPPLIKRGLSR
ncbi:hypothetical protein B2D07_02380 [Desulfococcus multivorans]|nr:hypothetical protein B2D07_02380 [Desulfococcus multivorans]